MATEAKQNETVQQLKDFLAGSAYSTFEANPKLYTTDTSSAMDVQGTIQYGKPNDAGVRNPYLKVELGDIRFNPTLVGDAYDDVQALAETLGEDESLDVTIHLVKQTPKEVSDEVIAKHYSERVLKNFQAAKTAGTRTVASVVTE